LNTIVYACVKEQIVDGVKNPVTAILFFLAGLLMFLAACNSSQSGLAGSPIGGERGDESLENRDASFVTSADDALIFQPRLYIDESEIVRNGGPPTVIFCGKSSGAVSYYTYVYSWRFSDNTWWGRILGYPSHQWDFEPVIARIEIGSSPQYVYDAGHYRAAVTHEPDLVVVPGTHYFRPSHDRVGQPFTAEYLEPLSPGLLDSMNGAIGRLPRLPFGRQLSLDWACRDPSRVIEHASFSSDDNSAPIPIQVLWILGALSGTAVGVALRSGLGVITHTRFFPWKPTLAASFLAGTFGSVSAPISENGVAVLSSHGLLSVSAGLMAAAVVGSATGAIVPSITDGLSRWRATFVGAITAIVSGLFALWI